MIVHIVCGYRSRNEEWTDKWTDEHYRAWRLVKAVKGLPFKRATRWTLKDGRELLVEDTPTGRLAATELASLAALGKLSAANIRSASIVPIPSSSHIALGSDFTGGRIARKMHELAPAHQSRAELYFDQPMPKAHAGGGSRRPSEIMPHLRHGNLEGLGDVVLIDDVMTTGGHMRACARYLRNNGVNVVGAVVIGRTIWAPVDNMFAMPSEDLDC